jgi:hypothetical protein
VGVKKNVVMKTTTIAQIDRLVRCFMFALFLK